MNIAGRKHIGIRYIFNRIAQLVRGKVRILRISLKFDLHRLLSVCGNNQRTGNFAFAVRDKTYLCQVWHIYMVARIADTRTGKGTQRIITVSAQCPVVIQRYILRIFQFYFKTRQRF